MGQTISTYKIPPAFWKWFDDLKEKYPYVTIELNRNEIVLCRARRVISSEQEIEGLAFGKVVRDASGTFLERTFRPKYFPQADEVRVV